jgi:hypothetical protein
MTHLPHIVASYALVVVLTVMYGAGAWLRLARARRRLAAIDLRARR